MIIREARKRAGLTLEDVAEQVRVTPGALSHIESGRRLPNPSNTLRIAEVLGIEPRLLMDALDYEHSARRERSAYESRDASGAKRSSPPPRAYSERPIEELFAAPGGIRPEAFEDDDIAAFAPSPSVNMLRIAEHPRPRETWRAGPTTRHGASKRSSSSPTPRPTRSAHCAGCSRTRTRWFAEEARRLLRELDVRLPEE